MNELQDTQIWQMRVYYSETAMGNATGVVVGEISQDRQEMARTLGYPDTIFLTRDTKGQWFGESFSPAGKLEFCTQTFLATEAFFRATGSAGDGARTLQVGKRCVQLGIDAEPKAGLSWVRWPEAIPEPVRPGYDASELLGTWDSSGDREVHFPGARLYRAMSSAAELESVRLHPGEVMTFCMKNRLRGICLYCVTGAGEARLRVFPVSLDGNEDAATGGAVLGLWPLLRATIQSGLADTWRVEQGMGPSHRRGTLYLHHDVKMGAIAVGGQVRPVTVGKFFGAGEK